MISFNRSNILFLTLTNSSVNIQDILKLSKKNRLQVLKLAILYFSQYTNRFFIS